MFCCQCGKEIKDGAKFCPDCGAQQVTTNTQTSDFDVNTQNNNQGQGTGIPSYSNYNYTPAYNAQVKNKTNDLCLVGFILSCVSIFFGGWLVAAAGVIVSALGLSDYKKKNEEGKGLATAGVIIGIVVLVFSIVVTIISLIFFDKFMGSMFDIIPDILNNL